VVHRMTDHHAIELWRVHRRIMALHALRQRPAALPPFEAGFRGRGLLRILAHEDLHRQLVCVRPGLQIAVELQQARLFAFVAKAEALPMGEMLAHGRAQVAAKARQGTQGVERRGRVRRQEGTDDRGHAAPMGVAERGPGMRGQHPLGHQPGEEAVDTPRTVDHTPQGSPSGAVADPGLQGRLCEWLVRRVRLHEPLEPPQDRAGHRWCGLVPEGQRLHVAADEEVIVGRPGGHGRSSLEGGTSRPISRRSSVASLR
jgi:hypothetical protein